MTIPKTTRRLLALLLALSMLLALAACGSQDNGGSVADDIVNGDFEDVAAGEWVGWTRKDAAFNFRGVVSDEKINGVPMEKSGSYYFAGAKGGNDVMRGTLTSDVFKLGGNGFITFKMGAGKNTEKVYVEFFEQGNDKPIAHVVNEDCDGMYITEHLITKIVDLSAYVGKNIYIVATDNDDGSNLAHLNLDAFKVCQSDADVEAARAEYAAQIEKYGEKPFEEDETSIYIVNGGFEDCDLEAGVLTGWKLLEGTALTIANVVPTSQRYWDDRAVYGEGNYYLDGSNNGATLESLTGAIRSTKFTLGGDGYISFMLGAGGGGEDCYVALCDGNTDEELIVVYNDYFSDPALALTLLRRYMDASQYIGRVVYLKIVDNREGGFGFLTADDFRVSLTTEEVAALEVEQLEKIQNETYCSATYPNDLTNLLNYYNNYPYPVPLSSLTITEFAKNQVVDCGTVDLTAFISDASASFAGEAVDVEITKVTFNGTESTGGFSAFDMSQPGCYQVTYGASREDKTAETSFTVVAMADRNSVANGGFESGNLAGWTVLTDGWSIVDGQAAGVISADNWWGEEIPYNQAGSYHLDGWNNGIDEPNGWKVQSTNFTLSGSGFISVRMGGAAAAVRVYKADGTEIGYYRQTRFSDTNFPHLSQGGSWADMGTYVMDLSAYLGEELYIVLEDEVISGGWAHAFFDEVVTYYETAPDYANMADTVLDGHAAEEIPVEVQIPWQLATNLR